jgi:hypothetical protein
MLAAVDHDVYDCSVQWHWLALHPLEAGFLLSKQPVVLVAAVIVDSSPPFGSSTAVAGRRGGGAENGWKMTAGTSREEENNATSNDKYDNAAGNSGFLVGAKPTHVERGMARKMICLFLGG